MTAGLNNLSTMEYPGRVIIIGQDLKQTNTVIVYAVTGRSPSSQAREIIYDRGGVWVRPTDEQIIKQGDIDLLLYPAVQVGEGIAVSNGKHTPDILQHLGSGFDPASVLTQALAGWDYEPDAPTFTPRISGCICSREEAALSIIKRAKNGAAIKHFFKFPLEPGRGKLIATYSGSNMNPLPSFMGEPLDIRLEGEKPEAVADSIYAALGPSRPENDFRVSAAVLFVPGTSWSNIRYAIKNRHKRKD